MNKKVGELSKRGADCCAFNYSIGYINEHYAEEVIIVPEFENAVNYAFELVESLSHKRWEHKAENEYVQYKKWSKSNYDIDDWYFQSDVPSKKEYNSWHYCEQFTFTNDDDEYIQDCLDINECPCCNSTNLTQGDSYESICMSCNSVFNIPSEKRLEEVILLEEFEM